MKDRFHRSSKVLLFFWFLFLGGLLLPLTSTYSQTASFEERWFIKDGDTLPYRILYPKDYLPLFAYPVVVFLHGSGERGRDNEAQLTHGADLFLADSNRTRYPAFVIFPQCAPGDYWSQRQEGEGPDGHQELTFDREPDPNPSLGLVMDLLQHLQRVESIDTNKMYLGGLSMGALGTFEWLAREPDRFAAAFSICGAAPPEECRRYADHTSLWIFHGQKDTVVPPRYSEQLVAELSRLGADLRFTLFPDTGHNAWDKAFKEPGLLEWLYSK